MTRQLKHWDFAVRVLAATALRKLVHMFPAYFVATVLPTLLDAVGKGVRIHIYMYV